MNRLWKVLIALAQYDPAAADLLNCENALYHDATAEQLRLIEPCLTEQRARYIARLIWAMLDGLSLQIDFSQGSTAETRALESEARKAILTLVG